MSKALYGSLPYDPQKDFTWISGFTTSPLLLVTGGAGPIRSVADMISDARAAPGKQTFASVSSMNFIGGEMLKKSAGIQAVNVPYKGSAASVVAVSTGEATWTLDSLATVRPLVEARRLRILAVTGPSRLPQLPDVPTLAESGLKDFAVSSWFGVTAPAGLDPALARKINADLQQLMGAADVKERLGQIGMAPLPGDQPTYSRFVMDEFARYEALIKANNLQVPR